MVVLYTADTKCGGVQANGVTQVSRVKVPLFPAPTFPSPITAPRGARDTHICSVRGRTRFSTTPHRSPTIRSLMQHADGATLTQWPVRRPVVNVPALKPAARASPHADQWHARRALAVRTPHCGNGPFMAGVTINKHVTSWGAAPPAVAGARSTNLVHVTQHSLNPVNPVVITDKR